MENELVSIYFITMLLMISSIANGLLIWLVVELSKNLNRKYKTINEQNYRLRELQEGENK